MSEQTPEARLERLFERFSHHDLPLWGAQEREVSAEALENAREIAFRHAEAAGRGELLDLALERVDRGYAHRLSDQGYWTGLFAVSVPVTSSDRANSQMIIEDLVIATVVEDLVPAPVTRLLRADGERLLRVAEPEAAAIGKAESEDDGSPPLDPFPGPWVPAGIGAAIVLFLLWFFL